MDTLNSLSLDKDKINNELFTAVCRNNIKDAAFWIEKGADVNMKLGRAAPPFLLQMAAENGSNEIVSLLIQHGAEINGQNPSGETALIAAAKSGKINTVILLLKHNAEINLSDHRRETALHQSAFWGYVNIVDLLIRKGANIYAQNDMLQTALTMSNYDGEDICNPDAALRILLEMTPEERNYYANDPWHPNRRKLVIRFEQFYLNELKVNANKLFDIARFAMETNPHSLSLCQSNFDIVLWNKLINTSITAQDFPGWYKPYINPHFATALNVIKNMYQKCNKTMPITFTHTLMAPEIQHAALSQLDFFSGITFSFNQEKNNILPKMEIDGTDESESRDLKRTNQDNQHENGPNKKKAKYENATGFVSSITYCYNQVKDYFISPKNDNTPSEIENSGTKRKYEDSQHQQWPNKKRKKK